MRKYLTEKQVEEQYGLRVRTLQNWRSLGEGPQYIKVGKRLVRYRVEDLDRFMESHRVVTIDSEPGQDFA